MVDLCATSGWWRGLAMARCLSQASAATVHTLAAVSSTPLVPTSVHSGPSWATLIGPCGGEGGGVGGRPRPFVRVHPAPGPAPGPAPWAAPPIAAELRALRGGVGGGQDGVVGLDDQRVLRGRGRGRRRSGRRVARRHGAPVGLRGGAERRHQLQDAGGQRQHQRRHQAHDGQVHEQHLPHGAHARVGQDGQHEEDVEGRAQRRYGHQQRPLHHVPLGPPPPSLPVGPVGRGRGRVREAEDRGVSGRHEESAWRLANQRPCYNSLWSASVCSSVTVNKQKRSQNNSVIWHRQKTEEVENNSVTLRTENKQKRTQFFFFFFWRRQLKEVKNNSVSFRTENKQKRTQNNSVLFGTDSLQKKSKIILCHSVPTQKVTK